MITTSKPSKSDYVFALNIMMSLPKEAKLDKLDVKTLELMYYGLLQNGIKTSDLAASKKDTETKLFIAEKRIASLERSVTKLGGKL